MKNTCRIGLLPSDFLGKIRVVGNAALSGASMLLLNQNLRVQCCHLVEKTTVVELSSNAYFMDAYVEGMLF